MSLCLLFAAATAANAALPRISLETPLTHLAAPETSAAYSVSAQPLSAAAPAPALFALPTVAPLEHAAFVRAPARAASPSLPRLPMPAAPISPRPASSDETPAAAASGPGVLPALTANAPLAEELAENLKTASAEDSASALEQNFAAAASLGAAARGDGTAAHPGGPNAAVGGLHDELAARFLARIDIEDGGVPAHREFLLLALKRMLRSPTARREAERFIAEDVRAVLRFETVEGSRIAEENGRRVFRAARAMTGWENGRVEVGVNRDYLGTDAQFQLNDLPPTLAHEILGHGLWYARAAKADALQAYHHHEYNETNARTVGWLVDFELDGLFEESGAWSYLQDPAGFQDYLKLRHIFYAMTFTNEEMLKPQQTLQRRLEAAEAKRADIERSLSVHLSWNPVIDHFVEHHAIPESRFRALRLYMSEHEREQREELHVLDEIISVLAGTIANIEAEKDHSTVEYLKWAAAHPLFTELQRQSDENTARLIKMVTRAGARQQDASPEALRMHEEHWRGQLSLEDLKAMYHRDRREHRDHWTWP